MTDQAVPTEKSQPDDKKASVPGAPAAATTAPATASSGAPLGDDASSTTTTKNNNNNTKAAPTAAAKAGAASAPKTSSPSASTKYAHIPTKGAPVMPPVPIHHPYAAHHHYYAYHQHMAAANAANSKDPKKAAGGVQQPSVKPPYSPSQFKKVVGEKGKQGAPPVPPPMYPPPPPHLPPHHHAYQQAWAAYRYAQQHSQYPPPPPPGTMPPWNAEAYAAAQQAYAAAASKAAAASTGKKGNDNSNNNGKNGSSGENGAASTGSVGAAGAPPPVIPPPSHLHFGGVPPPAGPYRYSDPTLRRDALSRISSSSENSKSATTATTKGSSPSSLPSHSNLSNSPPTPGASSVAKAIVGGPVMMGANHSPPDAATLHMLDLEARAEGATSPSQIEDFHREEVTTMGCTCKKTKCLKLYCQCFAVKIYCGGNCRCLACQNTAQYDSARQDAIRAILSRNPTAFDTKFQKNNRKIPSMVGAMLAHGPPPGAVGPLAGMDIPHARTISHKLGCKCRKSACIKKYCECYAGNVKCSANCRCVGCKNMPPGGFGPPPPSANPAVTNPAAIKLGTPTKNVIMTTPVKKEPSWMMDAAQNLAFLKHGSAEKPKRVVSRVPSESAFVPSISSSSEESPVGSSKLHATALPVNGAVSMVEPNSAERAAVNALKSSEKTAVNALLMAAMAMTEMGGDKDSITSTRENRQDASTKNGAALTSSAATTSPLTNRESNGSTHESPEATNRSTDDHFETPQRNLFKKFMSPKRKAGDRNAEDQQYIQTDSSNNADPSKFPSRDLASSDAYRERVEDDEDDSPKREHPGDGTPSLLQKVKRSRLGSLKKGARLLEREISNGEHSLVEGTSTNGVIPMEMSTPAKSTGGVNIADLTPVSARCIDFKKMRVNDSSSDPAVVDSVSH